jgi:hypothetical protein
MLSLFLSGCAGLRCQKVITSNPPTLNDAHQNHDDGQHQEDMNKPSHGVGGNHPKEPENDEYDGDCFEHGERRLRLAFDWNPGQCAGRRLKVPPATRLPIPPINSQMALFVGDPVKNREKSEPIEFDELIPKTISTIPRMINAIPKALFILNPSL